MKSADTRERIIAVAREVFSELGYDAATFQTIAVRADLTRPAINHYFPSKRVLYREILERTYDLVIAPALRRAQCETSLIGRLSSFIDFVVQITAEDRSIATFVIGSVVESERHPELRLVGKDSLLHSRDFLTAAITSAVENGELTLDADISSLVEMLAAVIWGVGFYGAYVGDPAELRAAGADLQRLLANKLWHFNS